MNFFYKILLICFLYCFPQQLFATNEADIFAIDAQECTEQLQAIAAVEQEVLQRGHENISYQTLALEQNQALNDANLTRVLEATSLTVRTNDMPITKPFVWGLCLGVAGLAAVYFVTQENKDIKWAAFGCTLNAAILAAGFVLFL